MKKFVTKSNVQSLNAIHLWINLLDYNPIGLLNYRRFVLVPPNFGWLWIADYLASHVNDGSGFFGQVAQGSDEFQWARILDSACGRLNFRSEINYRAEPRENSFIILIKLILSEIFI